MNVKKFQSDLQKEFAKGDVFTTPIKILIPQAQHSKCPKCGKLTRRQGFTTTNETIFGCMNNHDFISWHIPPKEVIMSECDLVGLLLAWHFGNVPECLNVVRSGSMLTVGE